MIVRRWIDGQFVLVPSESIRAELARTLAKPYFANRVGVQDRAGYLVLLQTVAEPVSPTIRVDGVAAHPEDDRVLEAALAGRVDYLVTGDKGLQRLGAVAGIPILDPAGFVAVLDEAGN